MAVLGVWMEPERLHTAGGADGTAARCAEIGVTDLFFLTKGLAGIAYYDSAIAPHGSGDPLREIIDSAHRRGIRVHAWFTSTCDGHYKTMHPESGRCHYTRGKDKEYISLRDEGYLEYMRQVIREVCRGYEIDGVHQDYIRYNHLLYGWDEGDLARYAAAGADIGRLREMTERTFLRGEESERNYIFDALRRGDESAAAMAAVRREDVNRFAGALCEAARAERASLTQTAALMPDGAYGDSAFADLHYGQSYEDAAALYDYVLPMAYSQTYGKDSVWVRRVADETVKKGARAVMGLQAYEGETGESLRRDLAALEDAPVDGVCLFRYGSFAAALPGGGGTLLYNPTDVPLTSAWADGEETELRSPVEPGGQGLLDVPFPPKGLRVYSGSTEVCVYTAGSVKREEDP